MSAEAPKVVAMVPTWNGERFVANTLASLAAQDYPNLEILVKDDASSDGTMDVCTRFAEQDDRFRVERQSTRLGWIGNANALLAAVDGDFAFFAPQDDLFAPTYVRRMVEALSQRGDAVLAYSHTVAFDDDGRRELRTAVYPGRAGTRTRRGLRYLFMAHDHGRSVPFRGVARVSVLRHVGGLRRTRAIEFGADVRWLLRLNLLGPFVVVPESLCEKRVYPKGVHHAGVARKASNPDVAGAGPIARVLARGSNARLRVQEQLLYASEIRAARLRWPEAVVLYAGVAIRLGAGILPWPMRVRVRLLLERAFVESG